jgi:hypothetical protein
MAAALGTTRTARERNFGERRFPVIAPTHASARRRGRRRAQYHCAARAARDHGLMTSIRSTNGSAPGWTDGSRSWMRGKSDTSTPSRSSSIISYRTNVSDSFGKRDTR